MRESKFELYRILCGYLIIIDHFIQHTENNFWSILNHEMSFNVFISIVLGSFGQVGVTGFIILSSWFLIDKSEIKYTKLLNICIETISYCLLICGLLYVYNPQWVSKTDVIHALLSPINGEYWFITCYILWYIFLPYIVTLCKGLDKHELLKLCIVFGILVSINQFMFLDWLSHVSYFIWITMVVYLLKKDMTFLNKYGCMIFGIATSIMEVCLIGSKVIFGSVFKRFFGTDTILVAAIAFGLFGMLYGCKIGSNKVINWLGGSSLAVYIIHENVILHGNGVAANGIVVLENEILHLDELFKNPFWVVYILLMGVGVYLVCCIIGTIYSYFVKVLSGVYSKCKKNLILTKK